MTTDTTTTASATTTTKDTHACPVGSQVCSNESPCPYCNHAHLATYSVPELEGVAEAAAGEIADLTNQLQAIAMHLEHRHPRHRRALAM